MGLRAGMVLVLVALGAARADKVDEEIARAHFATGLSYYDSNQYGAAVREFLDAYRLSHRTALLFNIARAYEKLDDPGRASDYYRRYLAVEPNAIERNEIARKLMALMPRVGTLVVHTSVPNGTVVIDDEPVGLAPVDPQLLSAGPHEVEVRKEGFVAIKVTATVRARETVAVDVGASDAPPIVPPVVAPPTVIPIVPAHPTPVESPRPRWVWPVVGVAAAVVVVAIAVGLIVGLSGTDFSAQGRASCPSSSCVLLDVMAGSR